MACGNVIPWVMKPLAEGLSGQETCDLPPHKVEVGIASA